MEVDYDKMLEELYITTLENLKQMKEILDKKADEDTSKHNQVIQKLNDQYNSCVEHFKELYGFK
jgi:RPA family protein